MKSNGVLAFCGSKGSGKDTSCNIFKTFYHGEVEEIALAKHLKIVATEVFNMDMKNFLDPSLKEVELETFIVINQSHLENVFKLFNVEYKVNTHLRTHVGKVIETPRKLLQFIGTDVLHPIDPLVHSKFVLSQKSNDKLTIITDLRFVVEFEYFKEKLGKDFTPIYVKRSEAEIIAENDLHVSEREVQLFKNKCFTLPNETSFSELKRRICLLTSELFSEIGNEEITDIGTEDKTLS